MEEYRGRSFALVVCDQASFGMGRMGQILLDQHECKVELFDDTAKAEAWARRSTPQSDSVRPEVVP